METKEEIKGEFRSSNISLILDSYQDIFSDFDARPSYSEKAISDDFLVECERAAMDKADAEFELILFVPKAKRNLNEEFKIKKRLKDHFHKHFLEKEHGIKKIKREGMKWVLIGTVLMMGATAIETYAKNFLTNLLFIIMEPASWFSFWEGLGKIFIEAQEKESKFNFYKKMSKCHIIFRSY